MRAMIILCIWLNLRKRDRDLRSKSTVTIKPTSSSAMSTSDNAGRQDGTAPKRSTFVQTSSDRKSFGKPLVVVPSALVEVEDF
ncbi:TPA: hypothetical protein N0F65_001534 [Lagenidium giganteum]|uniref:Uncharacterized protein n=1 Tax=Lagenidium giganteum TaxID=4803 RepID=A0AAV2YL27_9STRA|nr:TPA: hypothetical protein N0F65_001534 [Lagenidium giganteum]